MTKDSVKIWRYRIPSDEHREGWGLLILDSTGFFSAVSDYGNYAYWWNAHGRNDFREFVIGLEGSWDYAATKLGTREQNHVFDPEATEREIKRELIRRRRSLSLTKEAAREEWEHADHLGSENITIEQWAERTCLDDPCDYICDRRSADLEAFCKRLLPRLAKVLQAELNVEKACETVVASGA